MTAHFISFFYMAPGTSGLIPGSLLQLFPYSSQDIILLRPAAPDLQNCSPVAVQGENRQNHSDDSRLSSALYKHEQRKGERYDRSSDAEILRGENNKHPRDVCGERRPEGIQSDRHGCCRDTFAAAEASPEREVMADGTAEPGIEE